MSGGAPRHGNWSVQELERLRQLLPRRGVAATAQLLRRSPESVRRKAWLLLRVAPRHGDWTASDDAVLRGSWGALELGLLAAMAGRTPQEVVRRANELRAGLRSGPWSRVELQELKRLYGTRSTEDLVVCLSRPIAEIEAMAAQFCLAKDKRFAAARRGADGTPSSAGAGAMPRWTDEEVAGLRALYADHDNLEVARRLDRTVASVANKAHQLGLRKGHQLLAAVGRRNIAVRYEERAAAGGG
jgi:hypothetical protein